MLNVIDGPSFSNPTIESEGFEIPDWNVKTKVTRLHGTTEKPFIDNSAKARDSFAFISEGPNLA